MIKQVVVTDAWLEHDGERLLNPALDRYETALLSMRQSWSSGAMHTPLSWYAGKAGQSVAALVASLANIDIPKDTKQLWLASPYHARMTRSALRVMPEAMLDWTAACAAEMCTVLNPLLAEDGLSLLQADALLLLASNKVWDIAPPSFAEISGRSLPDRHMPGADAGRWSRLLSEIQMTLHASPVCTPSGLPVHGLWLWGAAGVDAVTPDISSLPCVATRNIALNSVLKLANKQQAATMIISESEYLPELLPTVLPDDWLLLGAGKSVRLRHHMLTSALSKIHKPKWKG